MRLVINVLLESLAMRSGPHQAMRVSGVSTGLIAPDAGAVECTLCPVGTAPNSITKSSCVECQGGRYLDDRTKRMRNL